MGEIEEVPLESFSCANVEIESLDTGEKEKESNLKSNSCALLPHLTV